MTTDHTPAPPPSEPRRFLIRGTEYGVYEDGKVYLLANEREFYCGTLSDLRALVEHLAPAAPPADLLSDCLRYFEDATDYGVLDKKQPEMLLAVRLRAALDAAQPAAPPGDLRYAYGCGCVECEKHLTPGREVPSGEPAAPAARQQGHSRLRYDKATRTIVREDPHPPAHAAPASPFKWLHGCMASDGWTMILDEGKCCTFCGRGFREGDQRYYAHAPARGAPGRCDVNEYGEPWSLDSSDPYDVSAVDAGGSCVIADLLADGESTPEVLARAKASVERVIVCVNALAGVSDPTTALGMAREQLRHCAAFFSANRMPREARDCLDALAALGGAGEDKAADEARYNEDRNTH